MVQREWRERQRALLALVYMNEMYQCQAELTATTVRAQMRTWIIN